MSGFFGSPDLNNSENDGIRRVLDQSQSMNRTPLRRISNDSIVSPSIGPKSSTPFQVGFNAPFSPSAELNSLNRSIDKSSSPNIFARANVRSPVVTPSTPKDEHEKWFQNLINVRVSKAAICSGVTFAVVALVSSLLLQLSIWSPFSSIRNVFGSFFSIGFYATVIGTSLVFALASLAVFKLLADVNQTKRASLLKSETHLAFLVQLIASIIVYSAILSFFDWDLLFVTEIFTAQFAVGSIICAAYNVFDHDYQLLFGSKTHKSNFRMSLAAFADPNFMMLLAPSAARSAQICLASTGAAIIFGLFVFGFQSSIAIFNASAYFALFVVFMGQLFIGHAMHRLCRLIVMEPLVFPFPPPYIVNNPTPEESRNLCAILETSDPLLKLFAVNDFRNVGCTDTVRRSEIYILSQPAGNPRNWNAVSSVTLSIINKIRDTVDGARLAICGGDDILNDSDEETNLNREMLMMPPSARGQLFSAATRNRHKAILRTKKQIEKNEAIIAESVKKATLAKEETGLISRYDAELVIFAVEGLTAVVTSSLSEDRFGVVQKDLVNVVRALIQLYLSIDKYLRFKGATIPEEYRDDSLMCAVQDASVAALSRIGAKFQGYFREIGLTPAEIDNYDTIVHAFFR